MPHKLLHVVRSLLLSAILAAGCAAPATPQAPANTQAPPTTTVSAPTATAVPPTDVPAATPTEAQPTTAPTSAPAADFKITGKVSTEVGWTEAEVRAMPTIQAHGQNQQGQADTYTGVLISSLLEMAQPAADATTLVFVGEGGATAEVPLADVLACADCIVSFRNRGGFSLVMPGFASGVQLRGVTEIRVE